MTSLKESKQPLYDTNDANPPQRDLGSLSKFLKSKYPQRTVEESKWGLCLTEASDSQYGFPLNCFICEFVDRDETRASKMKVHDVQGSPPRSS